MRIQHRKDRQLGFFLVIALFLFVNLFPIEAANDIREQIQDYEQYQEELESEMDNIEDQVAELQEEERETVERIRQLQAQLSEQEQELRRLHAEITETEDQIDETTEELEIAEDELAEKEEFLGTRMRASYQRGPVSYLEVLFDAQNFIDFLSRLTYIQAIVDKDLELIAEVEQERDIIQAKKEDLEEQEAHLRGLFAEAEEKRQQIEQNQEQQQRLYAELVEQRELEEARLKEKEQEAEQIRDTILTLQSQAGDGITGTLEWPVEGFRHGYITSPFGYRRHPITRNRSFHSGVDIGIPRTRWPGSPSYSGNPVNIVAAEHGTVMYAGVMGSMNTGYGRVIIVDHGDGYATLYAHAHQILVNEGQGVERGQPIAIVGSTGSSTGPHLLLRFKRTGKPKTQWNTCLNG